MSPISTASARSSTRRSTRSRRRCRWTRLRCCADRQRRSRNVIPLSWPPAMGDRSAGAFPMSASRRQILLSGGAGLIGVASGLARPGLSRAADRPILTHGLQSGDVGTDSAVVWARSDRPARAVIEWATTESFSDIRGGVFADALPETDGTVKVALTGLPAGQDVFYRVRLQ